MSSGILVGIDGSGHSAKALDWAAREAAFRKVPLAVLTVRQAEAGYTEYAVEYDGEGELTERARAAAAEQTDKVLAELGEAYQPPSVTVTAVYGFAAEALLSAGEDADWRR